MIQEIGLYKILCFPEKLAAIRKAAGEGPDLSYPVSVELSLTNRCNQNCLWCSDKNLRERSPDRLNMAVLRKLFADLASGGTRGVTFEGGGEPTIADFFEESVLAARESGLAAGLITNGLDIFSVRNPAVYENFEWIRVSLDAADRGQYQRLKGTDGFGRVLANIGRLAELAPFAALGAGYVLSNENDDPEKLYALAGRLRQLGAAYLHIRPVVDHPAMVSARPLMSLKEIETADFSVNLLALHDNLPRGNNGLSCLAHSLSAVIGADGLLWLCGRLNANPSASPMGSLLESSFHDIWFGAERAAQAALAASGDFCAENCPQCRMAKYNLMLADLARLKTKNFI